MSAAQTPVVIADARIDSVLTSAIGNYGFPGGTAALITRDTIFVGRAGVRHVGDTTRVQLGDRFQTGSNTKAFTATLAAMAVERGLLRWETRPAEVFPSIEDSLNPAFHDVTLRDLLQMRAGIQRDYSKLPSSVEKGTVVEQRRHLLSYALRSPPASKVGEFAYSNAGYAIVGAMIEAAFHQSWDTLVRDSLARPLGIDVHFGWPARDDPRQPWGHVFVKGRLRPQDPREFRYPPIVDPAGAVSLSIENFARWVQFNLRGLTGTDSLIRSTTMQVLHTPRDVYAMGWMRAPDSAARRRPDCADEVFGSAGRQSMHNGTAGSFWTDARILPEKGVAVAIMINALMPNTAAIVDDICKGVLAPRSAIRR